MLSYRSGDATYLETSGPAIIAHVCRDDGNWRGSFCESLSRRWAEPESAYLLWSKQGSWEDQGFALGGVQLVPVTKKIQVANMIARRDTEGSQALRYGALETCLHKVLRMALAAQACLHMPCLGTGSGGGDWERLEAMLFKMLHPVDVVIYQGPPAGMVTPPHP